MHDKKKRKRMLRKEGRNEERKLRHYHKLNEGKRKEDNEERKETRLKEWKGSKKTLNEERKRGRREMKKERTLADYKKH